MKGLGYEHNRALGLNGSRVYRVRIELGFGVVLRHKQFLKPA